MDQAIDSYPAEHRTGSGTLCEQIHVMVAVIHGPASVLGYGPVHGSAGSCSEESFGAEGTAVLVRHRIRSVAVAVANAVAASS